MQKSKLFHFSKIVLTICYFLLIAFPIVVSADNVTLEWDANNPAPDGYRLFVRQGSASYDYDHPVWDGTGTTHTIPDLTAGVTYHFVVRAYVGDDESGDSNEVNYTIADGGAVIGQNDRDGDGISDAVDAFPDDAGEWLDTDHDGVGNNQDADDDGDGMPDSWEALYDGLNPMVDDALGDLDGDGLTNLAEYQAGSDPSIFPGNTVPDAPALVSPAYGSTVGLAPTLVAGPYHDADGDAHWRTRYQVATGSDFSADNLVYDHTSDSQLTSITLIDLLLDPETVYYWRVRYIDSHNGASDWSDTYSLTTVGYVEAGDSDADGVLDSQQVGLQMDVDGDGTADLLQEGILSVNTPDTINPQVAVSGDSGDVQVGAIRAYQAGGLGLAGNAPDNMTGLVSFKLYLEEGTTAASVTIHFTQAAPDSAEWYKYDPEDGWSAYQNASFSSDRKSVTIMLIDGGVGDQDGVQNGVIVDPAGLGYSSSNGDTYSGPVGAGAGAGGCFISLPLGEINPGTNSFFMMMGAGLCLLVLSAFLTGMHRKKRS